MKVYFDKGPNNKDILIAEDAKIIRKWSNFSGTASKNNAEGYRNFDLIIPDEMVDDMIAEGWNVKHTNGSDKYPVEYFINVVISWKVKRPSVVFYSGMDDMIGTEIDESVIGDLDTAEIIKMDIAINPRYRTKDDGTPGVKGYVDSMDVWLYQNPLRARRRARMNSED